MWKNYLFINDRINTHKHLEKYSQRKKRILWRTFALSNRLEYLHELRKIVSSIKEKFSTFFPPSVKYLVAKSECNVQCGISDKVNYMRTPRCASAHTSKATRLIYVFLSKRLSEQKFLSDINHTFYVCYTLQQVLTGFFMYKIDFYCVVTRKPFD